MLKKFCFFSGFLVVSISCTKPDFDIKSCLCDKYKYEELQFFYETGFLNYRWTKKWVEDITISLDRGAAGDDVQNLDSIIAEVQPLLWPLKIQRVPVDGKITINTSYQYKGGEVTGINGMCDRRTGFRGQMRRAEIWLAEGRSGVRRKNTLRHELMHALGFEHPRDLEGTIIGGVRVFNSIDELENAESYDQFTELDKSAIHILYEQCVPRNLSRDEFGRQFTELKRNDCNAGDIL